MLAPRKRASLFRDSKRTMITEVKMFEVQNSRKRLKHVMNASELVEPDEIANTLNLAVGEEWQQLPVAKIKHYFALSSAYRIQLRIGDKEDSPIIDIDKLFVMNGSFNQRLYARSAYAVDNVYQIVGCTLEVS